LPIYNLLNRLLRAIFFVQDNRKGVIILRRILDKSNMTEADWQAYREKQKGIGGSDVATILGLNPYKTAFTLWLEKTGQIEPPNLSGNQAIEWGNILEPVIREKFAKETGFEVFENHWVMQHELFDFMVANIDGEVIDPQFKGERGVLEIKTAGERMKDQWNDGPPHHYMLQIQHYLAVLDYSYAYVAVLISGQTFKFFLIERDDYVIHQIIQAEKDFMEMVENNIAPEISGHRADTEYLANEFPEDNGETGELDRALEAFALRYSEIQKQAKLLQEEADYLKNKIKLQAKNFKILKSSEIKINMPTIKKVSFNTKQFEKDHPDLYEEYQNKETIYRSFIVTV
jgi:putative phage-type endonuclease